MMKKTAFFLASLLLGSAATFAQMTCVVAHRGYWDAEGSAQNSIRALVKADSIDCYGSEFDVWMTADGKLVVNHDASFKGLTIEAARAAAHRQLDLELDAQEKGSSSTYANTEKRA